MMNPAEVFEWKNGDNEDLIEIFVDKYNYIEPEYISLYITNYGEYTPPHIYRLFREYYGNEEYKKIIKKYS